MILFFCNPQLKDVFPCKVLVLASNFNKFLLVKEKMMMMMMMMMAAIIENNAAVVFEEFCSLADLCQCSTKKLSLLLAGISAPLSSC